MFVTEGRKILVIFQLSSLCCRVLQSEAVYFPNHLMMQLLPLWIWLSDTLYKSLLIHFWYFVYEIPPYYRGTFNLYYLFLFMPCVCHISETVRCPHCTHISIMNSSGYHSYHREEMNQYILGYTRWHSLWVFYDPPLPNLLWEPIFPFCNGKPLTSAYLQIPQDSLTGFASVTLWVLFWTGLSLSPSYFSFQLKVYLHSGV